MVERTVLVIVGPTGAGKTRIAIELSKRLNGEIVSADARQIYELIDIGTAKPTNEELNQVKHHFIGTFPLSETVSAGKYSDMARKAINEIFLRNKQPVVVGGSGLYVRALIDGLFDAPEIDEMVKKSLNDRLKNEGALKLLNELREIDPEAAEGLIPQNYKRILRALEVFYSTGEKISVLRRIKPNPPDFSSFQIGVFVERGELYRRIDRRVDEMIASGLEEEVNRILSMGYSPSLNALQTVGYREVVSHLRGEISRDRMIELIKKNTRHYAKRQMTWFKKDRRIRWVDGSKLSAGEVADEIVKMFRG
ncbi:MAG: tRNA (adenosine(37)-N6)-dimethylallyltransferase MiaA [Candidatus Kryptoniota bacterium]